MLGPTLKFVDRNYVIFENRKLLYFGGIDYHRMSNHPMILQTLSDAAFKYGLNSTGSRTTTGNHPLYLELEEKISEFFGTEAAVVFASGYLSNIILLQAIAKNFDLFFLDEAAHSSIVDAAKQHDRKLLYFKHTDPQSLEEQLKKYLDGGKKPLILSDGIFPSRGEIPPLTDYTEIAERYGAKILIDDAHAMAVLGKTGKGSWEEAGIKRDFVYQTGTMSKGFGIFGGIIPANRNVIRAIQEKSLAFIGSTGLALPLAAAAIQSISYLQANQHLIRDLQDRSLRLKEKFRQIGFDMPQSPAPIISITYFNEKKNNRLFEILLKNGIYPPFINYPGSPSGGHFRFALSSIHTDEHVNLLYNTVESSL